MVFEYIKSDLCRYVGRENLTIGNFIWHYIFNPGFKFSFWFRLTKSKGFIKHLARLQHKRFSYKYMLDIPIETEIGYGFYIGHGRCVVINPTARIGNNVNVSTFTVIGSNIKQAATIGDNVYIGPNVNIVDDITIGSNVKIGAGAVVTKDIPANTTAVGVPARIIAFNEEPNCHVNKRWLMGGDTSTEGLDELWENKDAINNFSMCSDTDVQCRGNDKKSLRLRK